MTISTDIEKNTLTEFTIFHVKKKIKHSIKIDKAFLLIPGTRQESLFLLLPFSTILEVLASSIWLERVKGWKRHPHWTKRGKIIPHIYIYHGYRHKSPKESTKRLEVLEVKKLFQQSCKMEDQNAMISFISVTCNGQHKDETKKMIPLQ